MTDAQIALVEGQERLVRQTARRLVRKLVSGRIDEHDVYQAGRLGLVQAARAWKADRGVPFAPYAYRRIHGAMLDAIRSCGAIGPQREWNRHHTSSLCAMVNDGFDVETEDHDVERQIDGRRALAAVLALGDAREQTAVLNYAGCVPVAETADRLGVSLSRVDQLRRRGVERIRRAWRVEAA